MSVVKEKAKTARQASLRMINLSTEQKNRTLENIAESLLKNKGKIIEANRKDLDTAESQLRKGVMTEAIFKRLKLDDEKLRGVVEMVRSVSKLEDPVGETEYSVELDEDFELYRVSSPIGVVAVIFESRPDALVQIACLCLKSGNAVLLKGGSEARNSNNALYEIICEATIRSGLSEGWIQLLEEREDVKNLLELDDYVDLIVPRGSNSFVRYIQDNTRITVLGHSEGVCHIYVDEEADISLAQKICLDAKVQYPAVCNAVDTILVHENVAKKFLPGMIDKYKKAGVEVRGSKKTLELLDENIRAATKDDWGAEYLDYIVSIKIVDHMEEAIEHINVYGSKHTDAIMTKNKYTALKFMSDVDSSSVIWNASTRFSDGYRYGLGAEVGISTGKIHARGPTGLEGLTIYKYYLIGSGQTVGEYVGKDAKKFTHQRLQKTFKDYIGKK